MVALTGEGDEAAEVEAATDNAAAATVGTGGVSNVVGCAIRGRD